jgi:hypothetical protein
VLFAMLQVDFYREIYFTSFDFSFRWCPVSLEGIYVIRLCLLFLGFYFVLFGCLGWIEVEWEG